MKRQLLLAAAAGLAGLSFASAPASACTEGARSCQEGSVMRCTCPPDFGRNERRPCYWAPTGESCKTRSELPQSPRKVQPVALKLPR